MTNTPRALCRPVTVQFRPSLAVKLMLTAEQRRWWAAYNKLRNHRERIGLPLKYTADAFSRYEIEVLREKLAEAQIYSISEAVRDMSTAIAAMVSRPEVILEALRHRD